MSGLRLPSILMHSAPLQASPTTVISASESRSLRRPSRKMTWSSAISILIFGIRGSNSARTYQPHRNLYLIRSPAWLMCLCVRLFVIAVRAERVIFFPPLNL